MKYIVKALFLTLYYRWRPGDGKYGITFTEDIEEARRYDTEEEATIRASRLAEVSKLGGRFEVVKVKK
jgi:hypothetical protein